MTETPDTPDVPAHAATVHRHRLRRRPRLRRRASRPVTRSRPTSEHQAEYSRFMPLIKWLLLIPHYIALFFLFIAVAIVGLISFFAVIFTRQYPRGMYDFVVGVARWDWRVVRLPLPDHRPVPAVLARG